MADKSISTRKGLTGAVTVAVAFAVAAGAQALGKACGVDLPEQTQGQIAVALTAGVSGLLTGVLNWWKHRGKKA
jgi:hypothetical protein